MVIDLRQKEKEYMTQTFHASGRRAVGLRTICDMCNKEIKDEFIAVIRSSESTLPKNYIFHYDCYKFALKGSTMVVCVKCKKEMQCIDMGIAARWNGTHAYPGDLFECPTCGAQILKCNTAPVYCDKLREKDIYMDGTFRKYVPKPLNLRS